MSPKEQYKAACRNARMRRNNNYHNFTDRFDARYHDPDQFADVEPRFYSAAKEALVADGLKFEGWVTSAGRVTALALTSARAGQPYYIPQWLKSGLNAWRRWKEYFLLAR